MVRWTLKRRTSVILQATCFWQGPCRGSRQGEPGYFLENGNMEHSGKSGSRPLGFSTQMSPFQISGSYSFLSVLWIWHGRPVKVVHSILFVVPPSLQLDHRSNFQHILPCDHCSSCCYTGPWLPQCALSWACQVTTPGQLHRPYDHHCLNTDRIPQLPHIPILHLHLQLLQSIAGSSLGNYDAIAYQMLSPPSYYMATTTGNWYFFLRDLLRNLGVVSWNFLLGRQGRNLYASIPVTDLLRMDPCALCPSHFQVAHV